MSCHLRAAWVRFLSIPKSFNFNGVFDTPLSSEVEEASLKKDDDGDIKQNSCASVDRF